MELLKMKEAAARLGLNVQYLRQLCRQKKIEHTRVGGRYFMTPAQCDAMIKTVSPAAPIPPVDAADRADSGDTIE